MTALVYTLRGGLDNEQLRWSLRSMAANLPHDAVWTVGPGAPRWLRDATHIQTREGPSKWANLPNALRVASEVIDDEDLVLCNDDFFVMAPLERMPVLHRGPLVKTPGYAYAKGTYGRGYHETEALLRQLGIEGELLNYETHVPLPVARTRLRESLERARSGFHGSCLQTRTLYGNHWQVGGEQIEDVKVFGPRGETGGRFLSTNRRTFTNERVGQIIRAAFPEPSPYEG